MITTNNRPRKKPVRRVDTSTKTCTGCESRKPLTDYHRSSKRNDGRASRCKDCTNEAQRERQRDYMRRRYHENAAYNLTTRLAARLRATLPGTEIGKVFSTADEPGLLPYTLEDFILHLRTRIPVGYVFGQLFTGELQIDHIRPICSFRIENEHDSQFKHCWALGNITVLPTKQNERKGSRFNGVQIRNG